MTDPTQIRMEKSADVLGTYRVSRMYAVEDDGTMTPKEELYTVLHQENWPGDLVSLIAISAPRVEEDGTLGAVEEIPAGTTFRHYRTDGETFADMILEDGRVYRIETDHSEWPYTVNGMDEGEIFEGIMYAG
jgi:hypothetical protein